MRPKTVWVRPSKVGLRSEPFLEVRKAKVIETRHERDRTVHRVLRDGTNVTMWVDDRLVFLTEKKAQASLQKVLLELVKDAEAELKQRRAAYGVAMGPIPGVKA